MSAIKPIMREAVLHGMGHAKHRLHQLADNMNDHLDDVAKRVRDKDKFDGAPSRIDVSVRSFKRNKKHDSAEFNRQHDEQIEALQSMSLADWIRNRSEYLRNGRTSDSLRAQQNARDAALEDRIAQNRAEGQNPVDAVRNAQEWLSTQAATHRLDGIAGGNVTDISGVGDSRVNSSLGSQWRSRVDALDAAVVQFAGVDLSNVCMNVVFR